VLPGLSVLWVILFVLLAVVVVDRLLFRPLLRVMQERERAITSARQLADKAAADAAAAAAEFDAKTAVARGEIHREMDRSRRAALAIREELLAATRDDVGRALDEASARLEAEAAAARSRLSAEADALGTAIAERVLDRKVS
jgi:F-type H+-transporting ATPase subunit b